MTTTTTASTSSTTTTTLAAPANVSALASTLQNIITWEAVTGAVSYNLYWSTTTGVTTVGGTKISGVSSPYTHAGLVNGLTHYYIADAVDAASNEGAVSTQFSAQPQNAGTLDTSFNSQGWLLRNTDAGADGCATNAGFNTNAIVTDSAGKILVTGFGLNSNGDKDMVLWRFNADGTMDTTFNGTGYVVSNISDGANKDDAGNAVAIDSSERILVAGYLHSGGISYMTIWRYNSNGTLDTSFNSGQGWLTRNNAAGGNGDDQANSIAIDGSGKILAAGTSAFSPTDLDMAVWRFNSDGSLDTTFNSVGSYTQSGAAGGTGDDYAFGIALDPTGRILVTGSSKDGASHSNLVVWRFKSDGTPDATFGGSGWALKLGSAGGLGDRGYSIISDPDGKIVVAGFALKSNGRQAMIVWRYNPDGSPDTTFSGTGYNGTGNIGGGDTDLGQALILDRAGKIMVVGGSSDTSANLELAIWRFNTDGTLDTSFNGQGWLLHNNAAGGNKDTMGTAINIDPYGRIIAAGYSYHDATHTSLVVWRYK